jgi:hypothetical protein
VSECSVFLFSSICINAIKPGNYYSYLWSTYKPKVSKWEILEFSSSYVGKVGVQEMFFEGWDPSLSTGSCSHVHVWLALSSPICYCFPIAPGSQVSRANLSSKLSNHLSLTPEHSPGCFLFTIPLPPSVIKSPWSQGPLVWPTLSWYQAAYTCNRSQIHSGSKLSAEINPLTFLLLSPTTLWNRLMLCVWLELEGICVFIFLVYVWQIVPEPCAVDVSKLSLIIRAWSSGPMDDLHCLNNAHLDPA